MDCEEYAEVYRVYAEQYDAEYKDKWQRMRLLASIVIQPHLAKGRKVTPEKLLPFPWDKKTTAADKPALTADEQRKRMEELVKRIGDKTI